MNITQYEALCSDLSSLLDKKFFFVVGLPKSGTTWLQILLDQHPNMVCKGEAYFAKKLSPSIHQTVVDYNKRLKFGKKKFNPFIFDSMKFLSLFHFWITSQTINIVFVCIN